MSHSGVASQHMALLQKCNHTQLGLAASAELSDRIFQTFAK